MASRYEVEVTVTSAKDLKNVNWRHGSLKPYAVVWVDPMNKCSTRVAVEGGDGGDTSAVWNEKILIPFNSPIEESTLHIDIVHARAAGEEETKPLIGSAKIPLDDVALGGDAADYKLDLKRPSGRPQGKIDVKISVRDPRYRAPEPYYAPPYGVPPPGTGTRDYAAPPPYASPYGAPPAPYAAPPSGYPAYGAAPPPIYGQPGYGYGQGQPGYGQGYSVVEEKKKGKFGGMGMGTGLAVGAAAGALGGLALAEGFDALEDKVADDAADRVEDDF